MVKMLNVLNYFKYLIDFEVYVFNFKFALNLTNTVCILYIYLF